MKKDLWLKILIPCLLFGIFVFFVYVDPDLHPPVSSARFERACSQSDVQISDVSREYRANFFKTVLSKKEDGLEISYLEFTHDAYATAYHSMFLNAVQNGEPGEEYKHSDDYSRFYYTCNLGKVFLYRNNTEMIYLYTKDPQDPLVDELIASLKL